MNSTQRTGKINVQRMKHETLEQLHSVATNLRDDMPMDRIIIEILE